jgi:hypothetical protein
MSAMIFIDNKYTKWYFSIITTAQNRKLSLGTYSEIHHIIPKSLGGDNTTDNLVKLTAREHYICHLLLVKMTAGKEQYRMAQAMSAFMTWNNTNHKRTVHITSRIYDYLKKVKSEQLKIMWASDVSYREKALSGLKKLETNTKHKQKMSSVRKALWKDDAYIAKMKNRPKQYKRVMINGQEYNSLQEAGFAHGITANNVSKRCRSDNFKEWNYI